MKAASTDHNQANNQKQPSENSVREGVLRKILTTLFIELTDKYLLFRANWTKTWKEDWNNFESFIRHVAVYNHKSHWH